MKICFNMSVRQVKYPMIIAGFWLFCFVFRHDLTMCTSEWSCTHHIVHVVLNLKAIFPPHPPESRDYRHVPLHPAVISVLKSLCLICFTTYQHGTYLVVH